jgi:hypothetical protein
MVAAWIRLVDPSFFSILFVAVLSIWYGAHRSVQLGRHLARQPSALSPSGAVEDTHIRWYHVIILPCCGSITLVLLFLFFDKLVYFLLAIVLLQAAASLAYILDPMFSMLPRWFSFFRKADVRFGKLGSLTRSSVMNGICCLLLQVAWLLTGSWVLSNVIALGMATAVPSFLRFPSIKISAALLITFLLYDIYWVFLSPIFFGGASVMESVARKSVFYLPVVIVFPHVLLNGYSLLGLGDIVLPSFLITFALNFDVHKQAQGIQTMYFKVCLVGYTVGLVCAMAAATGMERGQPALLYLVPCTLGPLVIYGHWLRQLPELWRGPSSALPLPLDGHTKQESDDVGGDNDTNDTNGDADNMPLVPVHVHSTSTAPSQPG